MNSLSVSDVQYSCFLCCTKFLFSMLYKIPFFNDVQYSCMRCCTLVCFALICCIKVWMYIILVGVLYLILMYTIIATHCNLATCYKVTQVVAVNFWWHLFGNCILFSIRGLHSNRNLEFDVSKSCSVTTLCSRHPYTLLESHPSIWTCTKREYPKL